MLDQEGASCDEGGRRSRAPLPARTNSGTRIMTGRDNREKAAQAEAMSQQGDCTSQAAGPGAQEEPGQLSESAQRQRKHRAKAAEQLRLRAESMQTAFAGMPGGQASSGAPVSAASASAQATMGAESQKSAQVSYGQVTSMAAVATGANKDVATSRLLSRVAVSAYGVTSSSRAVWQERSPAKSPLGNSSISLGAVTYSSPTKIPNWGPHEKCRLILASTTQKSLTMMQKIGMQATRVEQQVHSSASPSLPDDQAWEVSLCPVIILCVCVGCVYLQRCVRARAHL